MPGSENLGLIVDAGADVKGLELGERVVVNPLLSCVPRDVAPLCPACASGEPQYCVSFAGGSVGPGLMIGACRDTSGGWADSFVAHKSQIRHLPQSMDSETAVMVPEFTRALRAVIQYPPKPADSVVIVGGGSLGLLVVYALEALGFPNRPLVLTEHPFEADAARELFGAQAVLAAGNVETYEDLAERLRARVRFPEHGRIELQGGADIVYETSGLRQNVEHAFRITGEGKRTVLMSARQASGLDLTPLWSKGIKISGILFSGTEERESGRMETFDLAMKIAEERGLPSSHIITHRFKLEDYSRAFSSLENRAENKLLKAVFQHVF